MSNATKIYLLCITSFLLCILSYNFCYFIAEKYFFDKFFYYKNTDFGYIIPDKTFSLQGFGDRSRDLISLARGEPLNNNDKKFKIAIIGDSYVWGQGIKNNDRFAAILEKKLNQIRPTTVYSLGGCGDNIFDDYVKYQQSINVFGKMDLYIFAILDNDLLFNPDNRYSTNSTIQSIFQECNGISISTPVFDSNDDNYGNKYNQVVSQSLYPNSKNYCSYKTLLQILPKDSVIYFDIDNFPDNQRKTFSKLISSDLNAVSPSYDSSDKKYHVSSVERHPSPLANQLFADFLFNKITCESKWHFKK